MIEPTSVHLSRNTSGDSPYSPLVTSDWNPQPPPNAAPPPSPSPQTGEHVEALLATGLDRYALRRLLGVGGMGEVYQGVHRTIEKEVAIKVLAYEHRHNPSLNERFLEEAKAASRIRHDNVVDITDFGQSPQGCAYFVMEYLEGEDLAATLKRKGALPWGRIQHILLQVLSALQAAHAHGIVHRDIKPANCLRFTKNGDPDFIKVLDFGIARVSGAEHQGGERLTKAGTIMGTAEYMAPEQARGEDVDARTDLYAVGVMLFQMVTGQLPFQARSPMEILAKHMSVPAPMASTVGTGTVPQGVDAIIAHALAKEPQDRWASAEQFATAIASIPAGVPAYAPSLGGGVLASNPSWRGAVTTPPPGHTGVDTTIPPPAKSGVNPLVLIAGIGVLALGGAGAWLATRGDSPEPVTAAASPSEPADAKDEPAKAKKAPPKAVPAATPSPACPDGMVMVEGGSFFMGSDNEDVRALQSARPTHKVRVENYCIAVDEVTVAQFHECSENGECRRAFKDSLFAQGSLDDAEWKRRREAYGELCNERYDDREQHPINCVTWEQARDYCEFRGGRLPTEQEWEFAARGSDGRVFPWGDEPPTREHGNLCNAECRTWREGKQLPDEGMLSDANDAWFGTAPVGSFPQGTTQHGLRDIVGNVFEWTASDFELYEEHPEGLTAKQGKVIRGGAFNSGFAMFADPALRFPSDPKGHTHGIGFRCAADPKGS